MSRMDTVSVKDVSVAAVIGVHAWEREIEQTLLVSVDMIADVRTAAATDDLADALDYSAVAAAIATVLREGKFRLIETAAERVAERLLADFRLPWLRLELRKSITTSPTPTPQATPISHASPVTTDPAFGVPLAYTAAITIERTREIS
jgi:dihydroneopterin aldolase